MSDITYCEAEAQDDPRFALTEDTFAPPPGTWAPDCGHPACIEDDRHCPSADGWHDWECPVAECRWNAAQDACAFSRHATGDHSYALRQLPILGAAPAAVPAEGSATNGGG